MYIPCMYIYTSMVPVECLRVLSVWSVDCAKPQLPLSEPLLTTVVPLPLSNGKALNLQRPHPYQLLAALVYRGRWTLNDRTAATTSASTTATTIGVCLTIVTNFVGQVNIDMSQYLHYTIVWRFCLVSTIYTALHSSPRSSINNRSCLVSLSVLGIFNWPSLNEFARIRIFTFVLCGAPSRTCHTDRHESSDFHMGKLHFACLAN